MWNSTYIWPQARYELIDGWEIHGAVLLAWAHELLGTVYANERATGTTGCSIFQGDCFVGFEADLAIRAKWGENDLFYWDTEGGIMVAGDALTGPGGLAADVLWTVQTRLAMNW